MKFFVTSDIHGFFDEFKSALDKSGFDENNSNHKIIVCGDCFDRGSHPEKILSYLSDLKKKDKCILIRGNHETLLLDMIKCGDFRSHDFYNGTAETFLKLGNAVDFPKTKTDFQIIANNCYNKIRSFINYMLDYYETENYIFVHSWIPTMVKFSGNSYNPDWRSANFGDWEEARWVNPFEMHRMGFNQTGKTIVFGHWHTSYPRAEFENICSEWGEDAIFDIYKSDNIIGLDACTAFSHKVNVLVIEDEIL